jgi:hypothetical protein
VRYWVGFRLKERTAGSTWERLSYKALANETR